MNTVQKPLADVGVIVGRFQVHELHEAHTSIINHVCSLHDKVIIFLGLSPVRVTRNNPLDFESRKQMILEKFPHVNVLYMKDTKDDEIWSETLDKQIGDLVGPSQTVVLYGSRDSFISHYSGRHDTTELMQEVYVSGSEIRKSISKKVKNTPEFRAGVIWAAYNQYPKIYTTVDIAILNENNSKVLLARKPDEKEYRFVGGFAEPTTDSFEEDAKREVKEEAGDIETSEMEYIGSYKISDWRYEAEVDKIKTIFFKCNYIFGRPQAGDDVCEVKWFDLSDSINIREVLVDAHKILFDALMDGIRVKKNKKS